MKLSLAWIFDHISHNIKNLSELNISDIINQFTLKSAEIESADNIVIDFNKFSIAKVNKVSENSISAESDEWGKKIELPFRKANEGDLFLIIKNNKSYEWAKYSDLGSSREGLFPEIWAPEELLDGSWKKHLSLDASDYILTIDNKSLTHRPDLWSHRGIAREMAVLLKSNLIPEEDLLSSKPIKHYTNSSSISSTNPFKLEIKNCDNKIVCKRFAGIYISEIENRASHVVMAIRLAKIDNKPINTIVDTTNYVMLDIGQPMHAFDSKKIESKTIVGRCAKDKEKLTLLDGNTVELSENDYIITDGTNPIALAGIMGGSNSAVSKDTDQLFVESANFDGSSIRTTSTRLKIRTESSSRFEKSLDPNQNTYAILRYLKLLNNMNISYKSSDAIISLGNLNIEQTITISQSLINKKIGTNINSEKIETILKNLGFGVLAKIESTSDTIYDITVPTYRSRDITIPADIIEEIIRFIGYTNISLEAPMRAMSYFNINPIMNLRNIKRELAFGLNMNEVQNYAFYDEEFIKSLKYEPENYLSLLNPLSQVYQRLVGSLVPGILKNIHTNYKKHDVLNFFEYNSVWHYDNQNHTEQKSLTGIFYSKNKTINFYIYKAEVMKLFNMLKIDKDLIFKKPLSVDYWYDPNQSAEIWYKDILIGTLGKINPYVISEIIEGDAFIFELNGNFLVNHNVSINKFKHLNKYQEVTLDISMLVPYTITTHELENVIINSDKQIKSVKLIDYFEKPEWKNARSITIRYEIYNDEKTLTKNEIDHVSDIVNKNIKALGIEIR